MKRKNNRNGTAGQKTKVKSATLRQPHLRLDAGFI